MDQNRLDLKRQSVFLEKLVNLLSIEGKSRLSSKYKAIKLTVLLDAIILLTGSIDGLSEKVSDNFLLV